MKFSLSTTVGSDAFLLDVPHFRDFGVSADSSDYDDDDRCIMLMMVMIRDIRGSRTAHIRAQSHRWHYRWKRRCIRSSTRMLARTLKKMP